MCISKQRRHHTSIERCAKLPNSQKLNSPHPPLPPLKSFVTSNCHINKTTTTTTHSQTDVYIYSSGCVALDYLVLVTGARMEGFVMWTRYVGCEHPVIVVAGKNCRRPQIKLLMYIKKKPKNKKLLSSHTTHSTHSKCSVYLMVCLWCACARVCVCVFVRLLKPCVWGWTHDTILYKSIELYGISEGVNHETH